MDDKKSYIVAEENGDDHNIIIVSSAWLTPKKENAFWPKFKHAAQYNKSLMRHDSPDQTWQLITLKRKFYETEDLITARKKAKQAESSSDVNDYDEKRKAKPIRVIDESDASLSSEEGALALFGIGNVTATHKTQHEMNHTSQNDQTSEGIPAYNKLNKFLSNKTTEEELCVNWKPIHRPASTSARKDSTDTDLTITPKSTGNVTATHKTQHEMNHTSQNDQTSEGIPAYNKLNKFLSNKTTEEELCVNWKPIHRPASTSARKDSTDTDLTITPKSTGHHHHQHKVMHLLTTLVEQNNQILTWIRSQNETDEIKRKKEPVKLPVQLPIFDENELSALEEYLDNDLNFGEMCSYMATFCGNSPTSSVNQILRHIISNELASQFSYRGKKGKRPFEQLNLKIVLIRTVKKHFKLPAETSIEDDIKVWLKHAPQRLKINSMKKLNSSSNKDN